MSTRIDGAACQIIPDDLYTSGEPSLNNLAAAAGDRFDVWQRQINRIILAKSADGFWSARNAVLSIPRQTGKTYDIGWVAIHRAARTPGMRIVWTAQHFSVIKDTFESMCAIVLRPEMSGLVDPDHGISLAAGKEEIRFRNGSRIFFRARERGALRGVKKIALLVIDEAQHLSDSAMASMLPTQNRAYNPQTIYMGTPPGPRDNGEAFTRLRDKSRAGRTHSTLYVEFTADRDAYPLDRDQWRKANPSYPAHTSDESIANLWENLTGDDFRREALGIWDEHALSRAIDRRQWEEATIDKRRPGGVMSFGIDMNPTRTRLTIGACMRYDDGTAHIELAEYRDTNHDGTMWAVNLIDKVWEQTAALVIDGQSPRHRTPARPRRSRHHRHRHRRHRHGPRLRPPPGHAQRRHPHPPARRRPTTTLASRRQSHHTPHRQKRPLRMEPTRRRHRHQPTQRRHPSPPRGHDHQKRPHRTTGSMVLST